MLLVDFLLYSGFSKANSFANGLGDMACASSIMFDDIVNGNVTLDGQNFFIGVENLITEVNNLNTSIGNIQSNITQLTGSGMTDVLSAITAAKTSLSKVPNDADAPGNASITYNTDIDASSPTTTTDSLIVQILGSQSQNGIVGNFWSKLSDTFTLLDGIKSQSSTFSSGAGSLDTSPLTTNLGSLKTTINNLGDSLSGSLSILNAPK